MDASAEIDSRGPRFLAALANLLLWPGLGHLALGRTVAGALWLAAVVPFVLLAPFAASAPILGFIGARLGSAIEVLVRRRGPRVGPLGAVVRVAAGLGGLVVIAAGLRALYVEAYQLPAAGMVPTLQIGDRVWASKLAYRTGDVERGDVIVFSHPCQPDAAMAQRVIALGGDTIEIRCDVPYVNGVALPQRRVEGPCTFAGQDAEDEAPRSVECSRYVEIQGDREHEIAHHPARPERDRERAAAGARISVALAGRHDFPHDELPSCRAVGVSGGPAPIGRILASPGSTGGCGPSRHYTVPAGHVFVMGDNRERSSDSRAWGPVPVDSIEGKILSIWWSRPIDGSSRLARIGDIR